MKLFIWKDVLCDYTCGVIFAMADTVDEARRVVIENAPYDEKYPYNQKATRNSLKSEMEKEPEVHESAYGFHVYGGS